MNLSRLYESGRIEQINLTASQQKTALRMAGIARSQMPDGEVCIISSGENGTFQLALVDHGGLGPKAIWTGTEWSPL